MKYVSSGKLGLDDECLEEGELSGIVECSEIVL
jgi:hypothetical protein